MITDAEINERLRVLKVADHVQGIGRQGLVDGWRTIIEEIERGYSGIIEEYQNDLDMREIIEDCGLGNDAEVTALDERFRSQLIKTEQRVWLSKHENAFWIYGYPKNVSKENLHEFDRMSY